MFERELTDSLFVQRWSIVRTLMPQSIAEHTFLVAHYANDIAAYLALPKLLHLSILQYALWHDAKDEIFTGDLPGPNKRGLLDAIGPEAKERWEGRLDTWANRTFANLDDRMGMIRPDGEALNSGDALTIKLVLKTADWLEAAVRMATEAQMGNRVVERHIVPNMNGAIETARLLCEHVFGRAISTDEVPFEPYTPGEMAYIHLSERIAECCRRAQHGQSLGPWITKEDEGRSYKDHCVDTGPVE